MADYYETFYETPILPAPDPFVLPDFRGRVASPSTYSVTTGDPTVTFNGSVYYANDPGNFVPIPGLPIVLDATEMFTALKAYREFLQELESELDFDTRNSVDHVLFGLNEAIEGLEKIV